MAWLPILPDTVLSWDTLVSPDGWWSADSSTIEGHEALDNTGQLLPQGLDGALSTMDVDA